MNWKVSVGENSCLITLSALYHDITMLPDRSKQGTARCCLPVYL